MRDPACIPSNNKRLWFQTGGHCVYCDRLTPIDQQTGDHVWPDSRGGTKNLKNLVPACRKCNGRRGVLWPPSSLAHEKWKAYVQGKEESTYVQNLILMQRNRVRRAKISIAEGADAVAVMASILADKADQAALQKQREIARFEGRQRREAEQWALKREEARLERQRKKRERYIALRSPLTHQPFAGIFAETP